MVVHTHPLHVAVRTLGDDLTFDGDKKYGGVKCLSHKLINHFKHKRSIRNNDILSFCCNHLYYDTQGCV